MFTLPTTPARRSPVLALMDICGKIILSLFVASLVADAIALSCLPVTTSSFWWAVLLNLLGTVAVFLGVPLWDAIRRRVA